MQNYKFYRCFFSLVIFALYTSNTIAQENTPENKTIKVKKLVLCQIDFTTKVTANISLPKNSTDFYEIASTNSERSVTIITKQENPPPTKLIVTEANGKIWNITVEYKADLDEETETFYDYSDKNIKTVKNNTILKETDLKLNGLEKQIEAIPYLGSDIGQLSKTYPGIDFTEPPPEQTFNLAFDKDLPFIDKLHDKKSSEYLKAFKNDMVNIRIVCQEIKINSANAYLKLLLQNNGAEEFLTGAMLLTLLRPNGASLSLHPGSIYPAKFPIIKPNSQIAIIYAFKAYQVADEDNLKFEIQDRLQKINLEFNLTGGVYNEARKD